MGANNTDFIRLNNRLAECKISLWGANLVSYRPKGQDQDVFWFGALNKCDNIHALRGGIPVCWPRVAEEKLNNELPRHGFARISPWNLQKLSIDETKIEAQLSLIPDAKFNLDIAAKLFIKITDKLEYCLETTNHGNKEFCFSEALHAYFNVGSLDTIEIKGLENQPYKNSLDGKLYTQTGNLKINGEFDSVFINHSGNIELIDPVLKRSISIEKQNSSTTVVWNPNKDLAEMSPGQYKNFVCIEPSNQGDSFITLKPQETHQISMAIQVNKLK